MRLSGLKYITQEHIDEGCINVTSAEMYAEVQEFNTEMLRMQRKREPFLRDLWLMILMNAFLVPVGFLSMNRKRSILYAVTGGSLLPAFLAVLLFTAVFVYFVIYRKNYSWKIGMLLTGILLVPVNLLLITNVAANGISLYLMEKVDSSIRDQIGYPHFVQLVTSYIREDENCSGDAMDEAEPLFSFDKYKNNDIGMLADTDIGEIKE